MKVLIISILAILTTLQIYVTKNNKLKPDDIAKEVLTAKELKGIMIMINYVDELVVEKTNVQDINQAYHAYFEKLRPFIEKGEMFPVLVKDTVKFKFLENMDQEAFDAVWRMDYVFIRSIRYRDTVLHNLEDFEDFSINSSGSFMNYLDQIGKSDKKYKKTSEAIKIAGDMSPSAMVWLPAHHTNFDFNTFKDRLWATVILLRIGDPLEEKVKRYLRGKNVMNKEH